MTWESAVITIIFSIVAYLIGSISFSIIISKTFMKEDIRNKASGNAGATNSLRNYGVKIGVLVLVLDMLKPIISVVIAFVATLFMEGNWTLVIFQVVAFFAIVGHIYPVFFGFKGGKGAATYAGMLFIIYWPLFIAAFFMFIVMAFFTKKVSLSVIILTIIVVFVQMAFAFIPHMTDSWAYIIKPNSIWWVSTVALSFSSILIIYKHKENIKRILNGTERTLGSKEKNV